MGQASSRPVAAKTGAGPAPSKPTKPSEMAPLKRRAKGRLSPNADRDEHTRRAATSRIGCCHCCCQAASSLRLGSSLAATPTGNSLDDSYCFSGCCAQTSSPPPAEVATTSEANYQTFVARIIDSQLVEPAASGGFSSTNDFGKRQSHAKSARNIIGWPPVVDRTSTPTTATHQADESEPQSRRAASELVHLARELGCCCCEHANGEELRQRAKLCSDPAVYFQEAEPLPTQEIVLESERTRRRTNSRPTTSESRLAGQIALGTEQLAAELGKCGPRDERATRTTPIDQFHSYSQREQQRQEEANGTRLSWGELILRYGKMSAQQQEQMRAKTSTPTPISVVSGDAGEKPPQPQAQAQQTMSEPKNRGPGLCHALWLLLQTLFPILAAFKDYSLPQDLLDDLMAGCTVAILHIPQGMAYGLLSGVEPIYGLYVSFIPVAVMALMSKSRHVSYGTFAIISMLLVNTVSQARTRMRAELAMGGPGSASPLVITNNHRPSEPGVPELKGQRLVQQLVQSGGATGEPADHSARMEDNPLAETAGQLDFEQSLPSSIEILTCVCLLCGLIHITMALLRLGALSLMFSDQLVSSFTTAGAIHVATSQLAGLFDMQLAPISGELFKCARIWWQFALALVRGQFNSTTALISLASLAFLLAIKELLEPRLRRRLKKLTCLPSELVLMALLIVASGQLQLASNFGVKIVGHVASGLPEPKVPNLDLVPYVWDDALAIALLTFTINLSIARTYAKKFRYELDPNQELFALGSANLVGSFLSCFPCASSLSRSSVQSSLNVKSQLSSIFSCSLVIAIVCYFAHILHDLPASTLSCIIMVALKGILMQVSDLYENWRLSKLDALVWMVSFVSVLAFGVTLGLMIGISASLFTIFLRLLTPNYSLLARLPGTEIYVDKEAFDNTQELDRVQIFRFNSALCYLNRAILKDKVKKLLPGVYEPTGLRAIYSHYQRQQLRASGAKQSQYLVIDCSALSYCDYAGASTLIELIDELADKKICVLLAACPLKLVQMIAKMQRGSDLLGSNVYPTISDAVGQIESLRAGDQRAEAATRKAASIAAASIAAELNEANNESSIIDLS